MSHQSLVSDIRTVSARKSNQNKQEEVSGNKQDDMVEAQVC